MFLEQDVYGGIRYYDNFSPTVHVIWEQSKADQKHLTALEMCVDFVANAIEVDYDLRC